MLNEKRILLVIGGGIAAYKILDLIRRLRERGAQTRAILTQAGAQFVTPLSIASLTGDKVYQDLFDLTDESEMGHIQLSRASDLVVVAPATANLLAKMAGGIADDLATTSLLATDTQIMAVPAMNVRMWQHSATQRNVAQLQKDGVLMVGPDEGDMACGEFGPGRLVEPLAIVDAIENYFAQNPTEASSKVTPLPKQDQTLGKQTAPLKGRHILITAGPTHEPIDPVRYIANRSSGKQGFAIASALAALGAQVTLISGPVALPDPHGVTVTRVETAQEMLSACKAALPADAAICAAAVADWRVTGQTNKKIKKEGGGPPSLALTENPDILKTLSRSAKQRPDLVIGFAAETNDVIDHATAKRNRKGCDWILANDVSPETGIMGGDHNQVHLITDKGVDSWASMPKQQVATTLAWRIAGFFGGGDLHRTSKTPKPSKKQGAKRG